MNDKKREKIKESDVKDLAKDLRKLYKKYEPTKVKIDTNNIVIFFNEDSLELSFIEENKINMKFRQILDLVAEAPEPQVEPEPMPEV